MKKILTLAYLFMNMNLFSQAEKINLDSIFTIVDMPPEFVGGQSAMFKYLATTIRYPAFARENGIDGNVYIGFVVDADGSIVDVVVKGSKLTGSNYDTKKKKFIYSDLKSDASLYTESVRVVSAMPKWKPGSIKGTVVRVAYTLPIKFKLE